MHFEDIYQKQQGAPLSRGLRCALPIACPADNPLPPLSITCPPLACPLPITHPPLAGSLGLPSPQCVSLTWRVLAASTTDTIISWNEPDNVLGVDYALSFQDPEGCTELWEQICSLQGRSPNEREASSGERLQGRAPLVELPAAELRNVSSIAELLETVPIQQRGKLTEALLQQDYIPQLAELFGTVEDLENRDDLMHMFRIFKALVMLNESAVYDVLLREDLVLLVIGALEYDPDLGPHTMGHRAFLQKRSEQPQVVPITDKNVLKKINQNYLLGFLKDVVLPRALDDNAFAALNQIAFFNNVQIISALSHDEAFLPQLRDTLASDDERTSLLAAQLLQELCKIAKQLQISSRNAFYRKLTECNSFSPIAECLRRPVPALRLSCLEVMLLIVQYEPSILRHMMLQPDDELLDALISVLIAPHCSGEKPQATEVLRCLLDPEGMEGREQDAFLSLFYDNFVHKMAVPVAGKTAAGTAPLGAEASEVVEIVKVDEEGANDGVLSARQHVCEILSFCVQKHSYRIKYFILRNNIINKVLTLAKLKDKCLVLAVVRFFRSCLGLKDEFYNRYIVKTRCFDPIMQQLELHRRRDNLVHSAILELFEFVRRENIKTLISHLSDTYHELLGSMSHVGIFKGLLLRQEQNDEGRTAAAANGAQNGAQGAPKAARLGGARRTFPDEDEDDAYFNESEDDNNEPPLIQVERNEMEHEHVLEPPSYSIVRARQDSENEYSGFDALMRKRSRPSS
tara:strand:- start:355 stop:2586 length:2232 start_codon:yes stop_codon:yes gene_type:complete